MATTILVSDETKKQLDKLKQKKKTSYDQIVQSLIQHENKLTLREQVANYYAEYASEDLNEVKEWEHTETDK